MITSAALSALILLVITTATTLPATDSPVCHEAGAGARSRVAVSDQDWDHRFAESLRRASEYQALGNYRLAMDLICPLREEARALDSRGRDFMLASAAMGRALSFTVSHHDHVGDPAAYLNESLALARELDDKPAQAAVLNDLANVHAARGQLDQAKQMYTDSAAIADAIGDALLAARVRCNVALIDPSQMNDASTAVEQSPASVEQGRLSITLARAIDRNEKSSPRAEALYRRAIDIAKQSHDDRLASFAWGYLGQHFEAAERVDEALAATRRARFAAQKSQRDDALYRWEWQIGRLYKHRGDVESAVAAYRRAVASLNMNNVRDDVALAYAAPVTGGDFRRDVGQLYYGLADLLLRQCDTEHDPAKQQALLRDARDAVELFKAAELKNYFQDDCLKLAEASKDQIDEALRDSPRTAVMYVVPLPDRCEVLLSFAGASESQPSVIWRAPRVSVTDRQLAELAVDMRQKLEIARHHDYRQPAIKLYDLLIRPLNDELDRRNIDTLLFVPDGELRQISLAALYDERTDQFLVQQRAVGLMPGLSLSVSPSDEREYVARRDRARLLAGGLSEARTVEVQGEQIEFKRLKHVPEELTEVAAAYPKRSQTFRDADFVVDELNRELRGAGYSIVHLATHAKFDPDVQRTFVVTSDKPMRMSDLQEMIQPAQFRGRPVDLLTLSACETAAGDDGRAAMGLAGIAIRAGARSAMATLWLTQDAATAQLVPEFYRFLNDPKLKLNKAQALKEAQCRMIERRTYEHPRFWATFVIIGNWR